MNVATKSKYFHIVYVTYYFGCLSKQKCGTGAWGLCSGPRCLLDAIPMVRQGTSVDSPNPHTTPGMKAPPTPTSPTLHSHAPLTMMQPNLCLARPTTTRRQSGPLAPGAARTIEGPAAASLLFLKTFPPSRKEIFTKLV